VCLWAYILEAVRYYIRKKTSFL